MGFLAAGLVSALIGERIDVAGPCGAATTTRKILSPHSDRSGALALPAVALS